MYVVIGTDQAIETYRDDNSATPDQLLVRDAPGERIFVFETPDTWKVNETFNSLLKALPRHIKDGAPPRWLKTDSPVLATMAAEQFGIDPKRLAAKPKNWGADTGANLMTLPAGCSLIMSYLGLMVVIPATLGLSFLLRPTAGRDYQANLLGSTSANGTGAYAPANYIGLTATAITTLATDTTLAGEVVSGTLARAQGAYGHVGGTNSYTVGKTFTSDQIITLLYMGIFNAPTAGVMFLETALNAPAELVSGDALNCLETVTI